MSRVLVACVVSLLTASCGGAQPPAARGESAGAVVKGTGGEATSGPSGAEAAVALVVAPGVVPAVATAAGPVIAPDVAPDVAPAIVKERSAPLPSGLYNPMPGGVFAGYRADTGLDIAGSPRPVYAIASGTLDYSEPGHTLWTGPRDTANCVRFKLDAPIPWKGRQVTHVYYAHLSKLEYQKAEGSPEVIRIEGGERLGESGVARGSPHLHIGLLLDGEVEQYAGTFLFEDEVRQVLGGFKNGSRLPVNSEVDSKNDSKKAAR